VCPKLGNHPWRGRDQLALGHAALGRGRHSERTWPTGLMTERLILYSQGLKSYQTWCKSRLLHL
jgi:hypothetical protein